jgi:multidrug transporter EmrE-like cation transporter
MDYGIWTQIGLGVIALIMVLLFAPGIKKAMQQSQQAEKDWKGVLLPIVVVIAFVLLLIALVK